MLLMNAGMANAQTGDSRVVEAAGFDDTISATINSTDHDTQTLPVIADDNGEVMLHWTAPGDDGNQGQASGYDLRYRDYIYGPINNQQKWQNATRVTGEPNPSPAGSTDSMLVSGLEPGARYYFCIKTYDDAGNYSGLSNSPLATASDMGLTLNLQINGWGTIYIQPERSTYQPGETIALQAVAYPEWWFTGWTGDIQSQTNPLIFNINDDMTIIANFTTNFIPGDANGDGYVRSSDVTYLINYFHGDVPAPDPMLAGDANGDCHVVGSDVTYLINFFRGYGPAPVSGDCGR